MIKTSIAALIVLVFTVVPLSMALAADGPDGNKRKGKYTYRKVYKACMETGEVDSPTPKISPADKKMAEWKTIFEGKDFTEFGCLEQWDNLSGKDVLDIYSYFYHHAADSPTPATCK